MKRNLVVLCLIVLFFLLQCTIFRVLDFNGIGPNLLVILVAAFGFMCGKKQGLVIGFLSGLLVDIFFGEIIGLNALLYMYVGFTNGVFHHWFFPEDIKLPLFLITISDFLFGFVSYVLLFLLRGRFDFGYYFSNVILPEAVYTVFVSMLFYPIILKINSKLETEEKRSAQKFV